MFIPKRSRVVAHAILVAAALTLAACESSDERAQGHMEKAIALLEGGNTVEAELELLNALKLNKNLTRAHQELGDIRYNEGNLQSAVGHYLRVVELDETTVDARIKLGQIMLRANQLDEALSYAQTAAKIAPDNVEALILRAGVAFQLANFDNAADLANQALAVEAETPGARLILASIAFRDGAVSKAFDQIAQGLETDPGNTALNLFQIQLLENSDRSDEVGAVLERLISFSPDEKQFHEALVRWHVARGDIDEAEVALRAYVATRPGDAGAALSVVELLATQRSVDAAMEELNSLIAGAPDDAARFPYEITLSRLETALGRTDEAIARLTRIIETQDDAQQSNAARVRLAELLLATGAETDAVALIETVLEADAKNAEARAIRAQLALRADRYDDAIQDIRTAQATEPGNWRFMLVEAEAHKLNGSSSLAGERMAAAVEASGRDPIATAAYARHLASTGKADFAESLVEGGLARAPNNVPLLNLLAQLKLSRGDWFGAEQIAQRLEAVDGGQAAMEAVMAQIIANDDRGDEGITFLENLVSGKDAQTSSMAALVMSYVRSGRTDEAITFVSEVLEKNPNNPAALILKGDLETQLGNPDAAETAYRGAIDISPGTVEGYQALVGHLLRFGRNDEAIEIARAGLAQKPDVTRLRLTLALLLKEQGDDAGAIAEYEVLYEQTPNSFVVANNLASMMVDADQSPEQVERAFTLARRLRDADLPHYKNTYGWLLYLRGEPEKAIRYLKSAADALPTVMEAQLHLGLAYAKLGLTDEARTSLTKAIELGGDQDLPEITEAKEALAALPSTQ